MFQLLDNQFMRAVFDNGCFVGPLISIGRFDTFYDLKIGNRRIGSDREEDVSVVSLVVVFQVWVK